MTPEHETQLVADVAVIKGTVEHIKASMVTHDQCEATRERARRAMSNGALSTYRERTWRLGTLIFAIVGTGATSGFITWLLTR